MADSKADMVRIEADGYEPMLPTYYARLTNGTDRVHRAPIRKSVVSVDLNRNLSAR